MQLPLGALLCSLAFSRGSATRPPRLRDALHGSVLSFMPLAGLLVLGSLVTGGLVAGGAVAASGVYAAFAERFGDARSFQLAVVTFSFFAAIAATLGVVMDLARAAAARGAGLSKGGEAPSSTSMWRALGTAFRVARRRLPSALSAWAGRATLSLGLVVAGFAASQSLGGKGGRSLLALWMCHQGIVLARVALRASWLARALRFVAPSQDRSGPQPATTATS